MKPLGIEFTWEEWLAARPELAKGAALFGTARRSWNPNAEKAARRLRSLARPMPEPNWREPLSDLCGALNTRQPVKTLTGFGHNRA